MCVCVCRGKALRNHNNNNHKNELSEIWFDNFDLLNFEWCSLFMWCDLPLSGKLRCRNVFLYLWNLILMDCEMSSVSCEPEHAFISAITFHLFITLHPNRINDAFKCIIIRNLLNRMRAFSFEWIFRAIKIEIRFLLYIFPTGVESNDEWRSKTSCLSHLHRTR